MFPVMFAQWMKERRSPYLVLLFVGLSIVAVLLFGMNTDSKLRVDVFGGEGLSGEAEAEWIGLLNDSESLNFVAANERRAREKVREGRADAAVLLMAGDYRIIAAVESPNVHLVEQHVRTVFGEELQLRFAAGLADDPLRFRDDVERHLQQPPLTLLAAAPDGGELVGYDMGLQLLFGFTLFLVMFTIGFKINAVTMEKASGIWNRMILSPVRKTEMYAGHLLYGSLIGFAQIVVILLIFRYGFGFDLGERFGLLLLIAAMYTLTIVALAMLVTGIARTPEQFYMIYPSVIPIMPLLSGVYMPPGTITNKIVLFIAEFIPLTHAMEALTGVAIYRADWADLYMPVAKLLLIGVLCMGIGINLVERRGA